MKIKKTYEVFGQKYKISLKKGPLYSENGQHLAGYFDPQKNIIYVDSSMPPDQVIKTLIHELGHALINRIGLCQTSLTHDLQEIIVESYSTLIYDEFIDKKKIESKKLK